MDTKKLLLIGTLVALSTVALAKPMPMWNSPVPDPGLAPAVSPIATPEAPGVIPAAGVATGADSSSSTNQNSSSQGGAGSGSSPVLYASRQITPAFAIAALILATAGFTFCFLGRRSYVPTLFLGGFFTFTVAMYVTYELLQRRWRNFGPYADWIYLITITPIAFIGGWIFLKIHQLGCVSVGALLGLTWGLVLLFTGVCGSLDENTHMVILLILSAGGGAAVFFIEHNAMILGTANVGSLVIVISIDIFARSGFAEVINRALTGPTPPKSAQVPGPAWALLAAYVVISVSGWFVQTRPGSPTPPSEWNPAYWLFGAQRPSPLPPTWFKLPPNVAAERPAPPPPPPKPWTSYLNPFEWKF
ncbi:hypothetical protein HDU96_010425 [Phlyctochytrium bullatum]|nr:hypothetical protein HDU96_010425 [Phlyctochytrium bullatum]